MLSPVSHFPQKVRLALLDPRPELFWLKIILFILKLIKMITFANNQSPKLQYYPVQKYTKPYKFYVVTIIDHTD